MVVPCRFLSLIAGQIPTSVAPSYLTGPFHFDQNLPNRTVGELRAPRHSKARLANYRQIYSGWPSFRECLISGPLRKTIGSALALFVSPRSLLRQLRCGIRRQQRRPMPRRSRPNLSARMSGAPHSRPRPCTHKPGPYRDVINFAAAKVGGRSGEAARSFRIFLCIGGRMAGFGAGADEAISHRNAATERSRRRLAQVAARAGLLFGTAPVGRHRGTKPTHREL